MKGFSYDAQTAEFTVQNAGVYYFDISLAADNGGVYGVPTDYYIDLAGVPRPSDALMVCRLSVANTTQECHGAFIMKLTAGTKFALRNAAGKAFFGTYLGNPFTNIFRLNAFQIDE